MIRLLQVLLISWLCSLSAWAGVNVNLAGSGELESLPGIGPSKAAAIIAFRADHGSFSSLADLDQVPGIGPATLANISPLVTFAGKGQPAPAAQASAAQASGQAKTSYAAAASAGVNVNTAASGALVTLPGIGPSKAAAIIADREANGPFASCGDLQRVRGIGPATVANIAARCATK